VILQCKEAGFNAIGALDYSATSVGSMEIDHGQLEQRRRMSLLERLSVVRGPVDSIGPPKEKVMWCTRPQYSFGADEFDLGGFPAELDNNGDDMGCFRARCVDNDGSVVPSRSDGVRKHHTPCDLLEPKRWIGRRCVDQRCTSVVDGLGQCESSPRRSTDWYR
jgi:hypothetical protein